MISNIYGRKSLQFLYKKIFSFALKGLNYGIVDSGEEWTMHYVKNNIRDKSVVFDVGANIGEYATQASEIFKNTAIIHAFEPIDSTFQKLDTNCANKGIHCHNIGFGDKDEITTFYVNPLQHTFASKFERKNSEAKLQKKETVKVKKIDSFCANLGIPFIDFLKLDIEGNEFNALKGAQQMLKDRKVKFIQFEFGGTCIDARVYFRDFWELLSPNYTLYRILKDGLEEIQSYHPRNEIFYYSNYLAELNTTE